MSASTNPRHLSMRWEDLTAKDFPEAVRQAGRVCLLPIGCLEKHGDHLPLGTDVFEARAIAERAVVDEPAVIFPSYYAAQIAEARHAPGTISYSHRVRWAMLEETVDEIVRNGMDKIVILNGHGGNCQFLAYFTQCQLERRCGAQIYIAWPWINDESVKPVLEAPSDGHGGEVETSLMMRIAPELVHKEDLSEPGVALDRAAVLRLPGLTNGLWWYARHPRHYAGDGGFGTVAKGEHILAAYARRVAGMLRSIKADTEVPGLASEFFAAADDPLHLRKEVADAGGGR